VATACPVSTGEGRGLSSKYEGRDETHWTEPHAEAPTDAARGRPLADARVPKRAPVSETTGPGGPARGTRRVRLVRGEGRGVST
jgi:hypothetical protein